MAADVDAVALVLDGAGDAAHARAFLQHQRDDVGVGGELVGGGKAGGPGADNHCPSHLGGLVPRRFDAVSCPAVRL